MLFFLMGLTFLMSLFFFSRGVKLVKRIHGSRYTARLLGLPSLCGFILLLVLITLNPSDRSGVDKSHLNLDCSKKAPRIPPQKSQTKRRQPHHPARN